MKKEKVKKSKKEKAPLKPEYTETGGLDYSVYYMKTPEKLLYFVLAAAVLFALGYIFYRRVPVAAVFSLLALRYPKMRTKTIIANRRKKLMLQFKDMLYSLSSAIGAGSSVERAMSEVLADMERQYADPNTYIIKELELIVSKLNLSQNIEDLFADLAERSQLEDIRTFANIFSISKRTGGNIIQIIRQTSDIITQKIETRNEIETLLAEKKMEQKIMVAMPIGLTFLLTETTGDFMSVLFAIPEGKLFGAGQVVCTLALAIILVGYLWGKKLTDITI